MICVKNIFFLFLPLAHLEEGLIRVRRLKIHLWHQSASQSQANPIGI